MRLGVEEEKSLMQQLLYGNIEEKPKPNLDQVTDNIQNMLCLLNYSIHYKTYATCNCSYRIIPTNSNCS